MSKSCKFLLNKHNQLKWFNKCIYCKLHKGKCNELWVYQKLSGLLFICFPYDTPQSYLIWIWILYDYLQFHINQEYFFRNPDTKFAQKYWKTNRWNLDYLYVEQGKLKRPIEKNDEARQYTRQKLTVFGWADLMHPPSENQIGR